MLKKFVSLTLVLFLFGCANLRGQSDTETAYHPLETQPESESVTHKYYDFDDIPIPREMKINVKESILFESQNIRSGMLSFSGRVNSDSLFNYFQTSMTNEGWKLISYIKYGTYIMTFEKPNKLCIVRIIDRSFTSELEIWVSPKLSVSG
jgi:hypothetical protein